MAFKATVSRGPLETCGRHELAEHVWKFCKHTTTNKSGPFESNLTFFLFCEFLSFSSYETTIMLLKEIIIIV